MYMFAYEWVGGPSGYGACLRCAFGCRGADSKLVRWNKRYFVITGNVLYYFKTQEVPPVPSLSLSLTHRARACAFVYVCMYVSLCMCL
jgi:hypothetical protein